MDRVSGTGRIWNLVSDMAVCSTKAGYPANLISVLPFLFMKNQCSCQAIYTLIFGRISSPFIVFRPKEKKNTKCRFHSLRKQIVEELCSQSVIV